MNQLSEKKSLTVTLPLILALFSYFMTGLLRLSAVVAMPVFQEKLQLSSSTVGFVSSAFYVTYALIQVVGGALCLRFGTMTVLFFCFAISGLGSFLFAIASTPLHIMFGRVLLGLGVGPTFVTVLSVIQANFEGKEYAKWMGIAFVVSNAGAIFSSAPLQLAINRFGIRSLFVFFAELLLCCAVLTFVISRINGKPQTSKKIGLWKEIGDVSKFIISSRIICGCFVLWIISNSVLGVYQSLWCVKWTSCAFSVMPGMASYSGTLIGIGVILGCLLGDNFKSEKISRVKYITIMSVLEVFAFLLLTVVKNISDSMPMLIISLVTDSVYGYMLGALCIQLGALIRENSDATHNAMIMGIMNCINNLCSTGLQSLSGVLIDAFAVFTTMNIAFSNTFYIYEVINVLFTSIGLLFVIRRKKKLAI